MTRWQRAVCIALGVWIAGSALMLATGYAWGAGRFFSKFVIFPAAIAGGRPVMYGRVVELAHFISATLPAPSHGDALQGALRAATRNAVIAALARDLDVKVTKSAIAEFPLETATLAPMLDRAGWDEQDYRKRVVAPLLRAQALDAAVRASWDLQETPRTALAAIREKFATGMPFADAARVFSEDSSSDIGGDLGVIRISDLPEWMAPIKDLERGEISDILSEPEFFWLLTVVERGGEGSGEWLRVRGIAARKLGGDAVVEQYLEDHRPWVFLW